MGKRLCVKDLIDILQIYRRKRLTYESVPVNRMDIDFIHMELAGFDYTVADSKLSIFQEGRECARLPLKNKEIWLTAYQDEELNPVFLITLEQSGSISRISLRFWEEGVHEVGTFKKQTHIYGRENYFELESAEKP